MKKFTKTTRTLAALLVSGTALTGVASAAEVTANVGATTDYIWRGMTQNDGGSSLSGGLDVDFGNGFYAGTWVGDTAATDVSTETGDPTATDFGTQEVDYYAGYAGEAGGLSYDVGYIAYTYPSSQSDADADFSEFYVTVGMGALSASYYTLVDADGADAGDSTYISLDYGTEIGGFGLGLHYGNYDGDFVGDDDLTDMSVTLSKDAFSYSLVTTDGMDGVNDDARFVVSWGAEF
ncbi:MAG: hypothetical protein ISQ24_06335 [PS1 clade bacterium]|nr:hypothetical protein [PS1 clade bacterium]MBL6784648.1 hypothetical protein [PS1 clade bacterium]